MCQIRVRHFISAKRSIENLQSMIWIIFFQSEALFALFNIEKKTFIVILKYSKIDMRIKQITQNFIALLLTKMHNDHQLFFGFWLCKISEYSKNISQQNLDTANLRSDLR